MVNWKTFLLYIVKMVVCMVVPKILSKSTGSGMGGPAAPLLWTKRRGFLVYEY